MLALPTKAQAITYLIAFGGGTVLAMAGFSSGIGWLTTPLRGQQRENLSRIDGHLRGGRHGHWLCLVCRQKLVMAS